MRSPSRLVRLVAACCIAACAPPGARIPSVAPSPPSEASITFLHINDVYEITPVEGGRRGGLARIATLKRQLERERGQVILTLGGDFLSPSALGTAQVDGKPLAGRQMVAVLNAARLDWATLGNHEFDIAESLFRDRVAESRFGYVISNVTDTLGRPFPGTVRSRVITVQGRGRPVRVGLVGTLTPVNRVPWVRYEDQYGAVQDQVRRLADSVDAMVAITHQFWYEDDRLATEIPRLDLILGGHEHENFLLRRGRQLAPILKADGNARSAQIATLHFGAPGSRPVVTTELVPITDALPADPEVVREVERWLDQAFVGYQRLGFRPREVIVTLPEALDARESTIRFRDSNLTDLVLAAMRREAPDAEVGIFNSGSVRIDDVVPAGPITQYDVIRVLPFGGPLVRVEVTGSVLAQTLAAGRRNEGIGGFLHSFGTSLRGGQLHVGDAPLEPERRYRVVTTDFLLTGRERNMPFFAEGQPGVSGRRDLRDVRHPIIEELRARYGSR